MTINVERNISVKWQILMRKQFYIYITINTQLKLFVSF